MFQIPMQETELPHGRQQRLEIEGLVLDGQRARRRQTQEVIHLCLVRGEQLGDDHLLVAEVVVEVARRDAQVRGDVVGGHAALALAVEQLQAGLKDAFAGLGFRSHRESVMVELKRKDTPGGLSIDRLEQRL